MSRGPYSEPAESSPYPHILSTGKNVHGIARKSLRPVTKDGISLKAREVGPANTYHLDV
jgi:hypothetical protein